MRNVMVYFALVGCVCGLSIVCLLYLRNTGKSSSGVLVNVESRDHFVKYWNKKGEMNEFWSKVGSSSVSRAINEVGSSSFRCTGECFCERSGRRISKVSTGSVSLVVAAVSAAYAVNVARDFFKEECENSMGECEKDEIKHSIKSCEKEGLFVEEDTHKRIKREYECAGYCIGKAFKHFGVDQMKELVLARDSFDCNKYEIEGIVVIEILDDKKQYYRHNNEAKKKFRRTVLTPFCKKVSPYRYNYRYLRKKDRISGKPLAEPTVEWQKRTLHLCVGATTHTNNINCIVRARFPHSREDNKILEREEYVKKEM